MTVTGEPTKALIDVGVSMPASIANSTFCRSGVLDGVRAAAADVVL